MIHFLPDYSPNYDDYSVYFALNFLSKEECDKILNLKTVIQPSSATTPDADTNIRKSTVYWLDHDKSTDWIYQKLGSKILEINRLHFGFDLSGILEPLQVAEYNSDENGQYIWHTDFHTKTPMNVQRKISLSINLTDDGAYEGGNIEHFHINYPAVTPRDIGALVIYPSYIMNRVTPVTRGTKHVLNLFVHGPNFK